MTTDAGKHAARGTITRHRTKPDPKTGANPILVCVEVTDLVSQVTTNCEIAMDDSLARTKYPLGGHVEVAFTPVQGELGK